MVGSGLTARAAHLTQLLNGPVTFEAVRAAGFYDDLGYCAACGVPYCSTHWNVSRGGYGRCPAGHGKSLDPHWSPDDYADD